MVYSKLVHDGQGFAVLLAIARMVYQGCYWLEISSDILHLQIRFKSDVFISDPKWFQIILGFGLFGYIIH